MEEAADHNTKRWLKPEEIMQRRRATRTNSTNDSRKRRPLDDCTTETLNRKTAKRQNPFIITSSKAKPEIDEGKSKNTVEQRDIIDINDFIEKLDTDANKVREIEEEKVGGVMDQDGWCDCCPTDWSLKTRLRVTSRRSLAWCSHMKTCREADGLCGFVQCTGYQTEDCQPAFKRCLLQWVYPSLPWLQLFPRTQSDVKHHSTSELDPQCCTALQEEWRESFRSVYHMLRSDRCPFFYLCAAHFTVVFRVKGMGGSTTIHALLTPSTKGIRDALSRESVQYSMPFMSQSCTPSSDVTAATTNFSSAAPCNTETVSRTDKDCDDVDSYSSGSGDTTEPHDWLESMGLDTTAFPTLDPNQIALHKLRVGHIDDRPASMLLISGLLNVQALFNYLLNSTTIIPIVGAHAGIPPTILSPRPFEGATLKCQRARYSVIQVAQGIDSKREDRAMQQFHCVDISGPILPHQLVQLCQLLDTTQDGDYSVALATHKPTVAFNCSMVGDGNVEMTESDTVRHGMRWETLQLLSKTGSEKMNGLGTRNVLCTEHLYRWT